jgi:hypothetical protein
VAWSRATYASIRIQVDLFCCLHCFPARLKFAQVSFIDHTGIINTGFIVNFVIAVVLRSIVDGIFQFHVE